jgi:hypothetical protein
MSPFLQLALLLSIISSSRKGLNMVNLVPTKETHDHVQAHNQGYPNNSM